MPENKLTIIDQVKDIETRSGVAFEIDITEVASLAQRARAIISVNDENFLTIKRELQQKRKYVTEYFKDARDEFNKMSKGIIQVQNTILDEFTGEEDRLIALDKAEKYRLIREARLEALPAKKERLEAVGDNLEIVDEVILAMEDADFELFIAERIRAKAETDRLAAEAKLAEERAAFEAEKAELARKQAEADRIEAARIEERERAAKELQLAKETAEREAEEAQKRQEAFQKQLKEEAEQREKDLKEAAEKIEKERIAAIEKAESDRLAAIKAEEEAAAKLAADQKWQAFLTKNKYNDDTDIIRPTEDGKTHIYRLVATYE